MKQLYLLICCVTLGACATDYEAIQTAKNEREVSSAAARVGMTQDGLIEALGYPTGERVVAGRRLLTWTRQTGPAYDPLTCSLIYEIGPDGKAVQYELSGNAGACNF